MFHLNIEEEQYALVFYLEHGKPGPVLKQIAEDRIKELELKKAKADPAKYPADASAPVFKNDSSITVADFVKLTTNK